MRQLFNLTLFLNIMVDTGSRGGDIAWDRKTPLGTCLLWEDVKIYAFWDEQMDAVDIRANLTFRHLKGMKLDPGQYKTVPLSLFPTTMAKEDTLRLILIMALMDDAFEGGLRTWSDLMAVPRSANGIIIPIKKGFLKLPLLRKLNDDTYTLTEDPEQLRDLQTQTRRLGRVAGLEDRLTVYCLRRGVAFILALKVSAEDRRFLMGHKTASRIYSEYAFKVATVDLAALYRDQDPRAVKHMSSMLLNSSTAAPQSISNEGRARARLDPKCSGLHSATNAIRENLLLRHGTLAAAARTADPDFARYKPSYSRESHALNAVCEKIYRQEYAEFFSANDRPESAASTSASSKESTRSIRSKSSRRSSISSISSSISVDEQMVEKDTPCMNSMPSPWSSVAEPQETSGHDSTPPAPERSSMLSDAQYVHPHSHSLFGFANFDELLLSKDADDDEFCNIDPVLLHMDGVDLLALDSQEKSIEAALGDEEMPDATETPDATDPTITQWIDDVDSTPQPSRLHGISRNDQESIDAYLAKTGSARARRDNSGLDRTYVDPTFCNQMLAAFNSDKNEAELASGLGMFFKIVHPIDRFFPGQEPLPGSYTCMFCQEDLFTIIHASLHVYRCALKEATVETCRITDELFPYDQPCTHTKVKKINGVFQLVLCGKTFSNRQEFGTHVSSHLAGRQCQMIRDEHNNWVPSCFHPPCAQVPVSGKSRPGIIFQSKEERMSHMTNQHRLISTTSPKPTYFEFCYEFVLPHELDAHFELHIDTVHSLVTAGGYTGLLGLGRTLKPRICIFCYHDTSLCASQRLDTQCSQGIDRYRRHINMHLKALKHAIPCPAYPDLCTSSECLDSATMRDHLARVHGIIVKENAKRKKKDQDEDEDEDENENEDADHEVAGE